MSRRLVGQGRVVMMTTPWQYNVGFKMMNAHMKMEREVQLHKAQTQWCELVNKIGRLGVRIELAPPAIGMLDMVFAANGGLIKGNNAIVSKFTAPGRKDEETPYEWALQKLGMNTINPPLEFEGQGDAIFSPDGKNLFVGHGSRTNPRVHEWIAETFDMKPRLRWNPGKQKFELSEHADPNLFSLELNTGEFYHLDTCYCPLDKGHVFMYPGAFTEAGVKRIYEVWGHENVIECPREDAFKFACNAVSIGDTVILSSASDELKDRFAKKGYNVIENNMSEFLLGGGSCKCCVLHLNLAHQVQTAL